MTPPCDERKNMARIELTIKFTDGAQNTLYEGPNVETPHLGYLAGEHKVAHIQFA